jgi:hypothetical protein
MTLQRTVESFVREKIAEHPQIGPWLADYSTDLETQILIDKEGLEPCYASVEAFRQDRPTHWMDDFGTEYRDIRIPSGTKTDTPYWRAGQREVAGPITDRWQYLGTSGWSWARMESLWVGFDFDSVANHSEGLQPEQLAEVRSRALELPYVTARTSKSGKGLHLLTYLDPRPTTRSHREHADLAKFVLSRMSRDCGFDFHGSADCCGLILWHYAKGMNNDGCKQLPNI